VTASLALDYQVKGNGTTRHTDTAKFELAKRGGTWLIEDVQ
jgi:hypothetical protein